MQTASAHAREAASRPVPMTEVLARAWPALPATGVLAALLVALGFDDGGYFPDSFILAGAVAYMTLAVLIAAAPRRARLSAPALFGAGALAAFAAWVGLSSTWSTAADTPLLDMQRAMLYVALFGLGLVAADGRRHARLLIWSVLAVIGAIVGAGLLSRLQPDVLVGTTDPFTAFGYRLGYPLEYWNAFGALASLGTVLALGLAADRSAPAPLRAIAAGSATLLSVAMYFSLSRGAWLALLVGLVVLLALAPNRGSLLVGLGLAGGALAVALLTLRAYPALVTDRTAGSGQAAQGDTFTLRLAALVAAVVVAQWVLASIKPPKALTRRAERLRRPAAFGAAALAVVVLLAGYAIEGARADRAVSTATDWVGRQWQDFLVTQGNGPSGSGTQRLLSARGARSAGYRVALKAFHSEPLRGEGAGSFEVRWMRTRSIDVKLRDAHSLPIETLGELGLVGLALLLLFVGSVAVAARRCLRGRGVIRPAEAAAVSAAFVVWLGHASVDWDWEMPALTGTAIVLCATLFGRGRKRRSRRPERRPA